jgi:RNA recognition motif-containing protein
MNIYVGNLSREVTEEELKKAFEAFGRVTSGSIIKDKFSGESKGFGFVEMPSKTEATTAMQELNGTDLNGRNITVNEARPREDNRSGGGGGGRRDGGRGGRSSSGGRGGSGSGGGRRF